MTPIDYTAVALVFRPSRVIEGKTTHELTLWEEPLINALCDLTIDLFMVGPPEDERAVPHGGTPDFGGYVVSTSSGGRVEGGLLRRIVSLIGGGAKASSYFLFGPEYLLRLTLLVIGKSESQNESN